MRVYKPGQPINNWESVTVGVNQAGRPGAGGRTVPCCVRYGNACAESISATAAASDSFKTGPVSLNFKPDRKVFSWQ